ncbi:zinc finger protein 501-like [Chrysoperla carnea]|uniref:zinc finger protein 501-like n=1 Tax=Chrysoperla carnea TaxID=189513 RepID=UPI001D08D44B|nr:zinc finger protein 501-like [Chrysoperla carnea]
MNENLRLSNFPMNFQKVCRTCLTEKDELQAIFRIIDLLKECTSVQVDMEDNLPKLICIECNNKLNNAFQFRKQCQLSEKILYQLRDFKETPIKLENNGSNSQLHKTENLEINEIYIKLENSYNLNGGNLNACDENKILKIDDVFNIVNTKISNAGVDFSETTIIDNKSNLSDFDEQPLSARLINENRDSDHDDIDYNNSNQSSEESINLRKNKPNKKSSRRNKIIKTKVIKKIQTKINNDIRNEFVCNQCEESFELQIDLEIHVLKHQKFDHLVCPKCKRTFEKERNLKKHLNIHMVNKPYKCKFCDKTFAGAGDRNRHLRIHTGEKSYICSSCGKQFPDSSGLWRHMKHHIGEKKFVCTICSKSFFKPSELRIHMRVHTGEKPYLCTECGKSFSHPNGLKLHKLKHTGERPFPCTECEKTFLLNKHLKVHMRSHTGEKPYVCKICEMGFARSDYLVIHTRSHTGERPYPCKICDKTFKSSKDLYQHNRSHNKIIRNLEISKIAAK